MKKSKYFIASILTFFFLLQFLTCTTNKNIPVPTKGELNLSSWDFEKDGPLHLNGEWEFYWKKLLVPDDFSTGKPLQNVKYAFVPNAWNDYLIDGKKKHSYGYATYRLTITTPWTKRLALSRLHPNTAFKLWVNRELLSSAGTVGIDKKSSKPGQITEIVNFIAKDGRIELLLQVSNHDYQIGGIWDSIALGTKKEITRAHERDIAYELFLFGSLLIIALYYIGLYILRRKEDYALWFGLLSLTFALRSLVTNSIFLLNIYPDISWEILVACNFLTIYPAAIFLLFFIQSLYPTLIFKKIHITFISFFALFSIAVIVTPARMYSSFLFIHGLLIILCCIYLIIIITRAIINKEGSAKAILLGFIILFLTISFDLLIATDYINAPQLTPLGLFFFIFFHSYVLTKKFAQTFKTIESLTQELETKVKEGTDKLEKQKKGLKVRNETIESELAMARTIQEQLLPTAPPVDYISFLHKPIDTVGGDLYDIFYFRDSHKIGIFLSDVSGHGVTAALISSMLKTMIYQAGQFRENPEILFIHLNNLLINQINGQFITALYAIFDEKTRTLTYTNAGHVPPYILTKDSLKTLPGSTNTVLGVFPNDLLYLNDKKFTNNEIILPEKSKLILCTDGLLDAQPINNREINFGDTMLEKTFQAHIDLHADDFLTALYKELAQFRGGDSFDDDVCVICLDVPD